MLCPLGECSDLRMICLSPSIWLLSPPKCLSRKIWAVYLLLSTHYLKTCGSQATAYISTEYGGKRLSYS